MKKYLHLLGLNSEASITDVKKAYRISAKKNHPDKFRSENEKLKQAKIMADITEAYQYLLNNHDKSTSRNIVKSYETDYKIYKLGLKYYNKYFDTFFKFFSKRELIVPEKKEICLNKAKSYFNRLLNEFPDSEWALDSKDKIKKIDDAIKTL
jgi:curved DNA-binding protein CbpA